MRPEKDKIAIFLHVATIGRYMEVALEVLGAIRESKLFLTADCIEVSIVGDGDFTLPSGFERVTISRRSPDVLKYEHLTLEAIRVYAFNNQDASILYLNCLGGRHTGHGWAIRSEWRSMLYYLLVERHDECLTMLQSTDVCGVDWVGLPMPHMTSNNWWVSALYASELPPVTEFVAEVSRRDLSRFGPQWFDVEVKKRHAGEFWIGAGHDVRACSLMPLKELGLPTSEYGSVPWWGLPRIHWKKVAIACLARREQGIWFRLIRFYYSGRFAAKRIKRSVLSARLSKLF